MNEQYRRALDTWKDSRLDNFRGVQNPRDFKNLTYGQALELRIKAPWLYDEIVREVKEGR